MTSSPSVPRRASVEARAEVDERADSMTRQSWVYEAILSTTPDFAYLFDRAGRFLYANRRLLEVWGRTLEEVVGKTCIEIGYDQWHHDMHMREIAEVVATKRTIRGEVPFTASLTGIFGVYEYIFTPVLDADGEVEAIAGTTRDVTARKQAEEEREHLISELRNKRSKLAVILEQAPALICTLRGPQFVFELVNDNYYEAVGRRNVIGIPIRKALPELEGQGFFELLESVYETGETFTGNEMPILLKRNDDAALQRRYISFVYQALYDSVGTISGILVHGVDVTELVAVRQAVRESEARFRLIAEALPQMVWVTRPDGHHEHFNRRWYEFTGVAEGSTDGDGWNAMFHPDDRERAWKQWRHSLATGEPYEIEYRLRHHSGEYRWTLGRALPVRDDSGAIQRWLGTCTDIDVMKRLTAEREHLLEREQAARTEAEAANRAKDRFIAVLSHELRTPLSPVVMAIPALEADPQLPTKFREPLAMIRRNIDLEVKLIDDLLDLSRVTNGKLRLEMRSVHAHELLLHAVDSCMSEWPKKRLRVRHELAAENDELTADPARLQQVFWNLLRNAASFAADGDEISIRTWNAEGTRQQLLIEVADRGVGITEDLLPRVFDAFEQGEHASTREHAGLGLGLAIAKAVVEMHDGTISAASEGRNQGATFTIRLYTRSREAAPQESPSTTTGNARRPETSSIRLLLVEDHADTAQIMARLLRGSGYTVGTATSVEGALKAAEQERFDLVVSDIGLPDGTGYELMKTLAERYGMKGIAVSGYGMEDDMRKSREAGFAEHIVKPVNLSQLEAAIRRVVTDAG